MSSVRNAVGIWSSSTARTVNFWHAPAFRTVATPNLISKRSECRVLPAERTSCCARQKRADAITAVRTIRSAILCRGQSRWQRNVQTVADTWWKREASSCVPTHSAVTWKRNQKKTKIFQFFIEFSEKWVYDFHTSIFLCMKQRKCNAMKGR